jgi:hypothetical protein
MARVELPAQLSVSNEMQLTTYFPWVEQRALAASAALLEQRIIPAHYARRIVLPAS